MIRPHLQFLLITFAGWVNRNQQDVIDYLRVENQVLRKHTGTGRLRFTDSERRRLARAAKRVGRGGLFGIGPVVTPDTLLRWHRRLIAKKYDGSVARGSGRPPTPCLIQELAVRTAVENPRWGYTRIRGALYNIRHDVGRSTIQRILDAHGIEPAPERKRRVSWKTFLKAHWGAIAATDFFTVEVLTRRGLVRYFVLFVIDLKTRRVEITAILRRPTGKWMTQVARGWTDATDGFLRESRFLIHDRDPVFTRAFRHVLLGAEVEAVRLPARSPNLNAYAERFVRSIKSECLSQIVPLGERHLRKAVTEYADHYHQERNHQGLENRLIEKPPERLDKLGPICRRQRLGGTLNYYYREAA